MLSLSLKDDLDKIKKEQDPQIVELRKALLNTQKQLSKLKERTNDLVDATFRGAYEAMLAMGEVNPVKAPVIDKRKTKEEVALLHATDWQGAKLTTSYNSEIMKKRVMQFAEKAVAITQIQRADHPVKNCVVLFGGDMVEGLFNYPGQLWEIDSSLFEQYTTVARLCVDFIRYLLAHFEKVEVIAEWGNHGRIGSKRDNVPKNDNVDRMVYELARQILADEKRLKWEDCPNDWQKIEIGNYRAVLIHGDEIGRNGFSSSNQIIAHINRWKSGALGYEFRDCYSGHYHTHLELPTADGLGALYQTGSTESDNRYARDLLAASATPSQRLHFIDPNKGRVTAAYKIWLD